MVSGNGIRKWRTSVSEFVENGPKLPFLGAIWVPRMSMEGFICIGINLNDKQTPFIMV